MTLQSEADALYGLLPEDFTAARNERAKEVRAAGERDLAAQIRKLPKPRLAPWVLNVLVRRMPDEVDQLIALGAEVRAAQTDADRDELRTLDAQRRKVTRALTEQARTIAADLGHKVNDPLAADVENTLRAAMADPSGSAALRTGLLIDTFGATGFEAVDVDRVVAVPDAVSIPPESRPHLRVVREPVAAPAKKKAAKKPATKPEPRARRQAQEALQEARDVLDGAQQTHASATHAHADALRDREQLESERATLQDRLRALDRDLTAAHRAEDRAEREQERAERKYASAKRAMERAESRARPPADD